MKLVCINKAVNFAEGCTKVRYIGVSENNVDLNEIDVLLETLLNSRKYSSIAEKFTMLRTTSERCEEKLLIIFSQYENSSTFIKYDDYDLVFYERVITKEGYNSYVVKYEPTTGVTINYNSQELNLRVYSSIELVSKEIAEAIQQIYSLKNIKTVEMTRGDKILLEAYKVFYGEDPNFTSKDINVRFQVMMYLLDACNISMNDNYKFKLLGKEKIPVSLELESRLNKLYAFGDTGNTENNIMLSKEIKRKVKIVGKFVMEAVYGKQDFDRALMKISKVIYAKKYCVPYGSREKEISEFTKCTVQEVESIIALEERIKDQLKQV